MRTRKLASLLEISLLLVTCSIILAYPSKYNWDVIPYAAIAQSYFSDDPQEIHAAIFADLRESVPDETFEDLARGIRYHAGVFQDPANLMNQLPFYTAKPLYPMLIAALHSAGLGLTTSGILLSKISTVLALLVVAAWLSAHVGRPVSTLIACLVFLSPPVLAFSGWITPDPLFCFLILAFLFLHVQKGFTAWSLALWPLLLLSRPDSIIFIVLATGYLLIDRREKVLATAFGAAALLQYFLQLHLAGNYGWSTLFRHTFVHRALDPTRAGTQLDPGDYLAIYAGRFSSVDTLTMLWWLALGCVVAVWSLARLDARDRAAHMILVIAAYSALHWIAFPAEKYRLLFSSYLSFVVLAADIALRAARSRTARGTPAGPTR